MKEGIIVNVPLEIMTLLIENTQPPFYSITIIQQRKRCWIPYSRVTNDSDLSLKIEKHNQ